MLGQLLANAFKPKYSTANSVTFQTLLPQVLRLQRSFQTVLRLWFNFHVWYLVASLRKTLHSKLYSQFLNQLKLSFTHFRIFVDNKQRKLIPSISPVRDECCIIILWKTCSTFGSYLPETVVELRKFFCCSFLNFDLLLANFLSLIHAAAGNMNIAFVKIFPTQKKTHKTTCNNEQCLCNCFPKLRLQIWTNMLINWSNRHMWILTNWLWAAQWRDDF